MRRWPYILVDAVKAVLTLGFLIYLGYTTRHALAETSWQRSPCFHRHPRLVLEWAAGLAMGAGGRWLCSHMPQLVQVMCLSCSAVQQLSASAGWILSAVYVGLFSLQLHPQVDYTAYDAQASTPARYFLLLRSNLTAAVATGAAASSQAGPAAAPGSPDYATALSAEPGGPWRWPLPANPSGTSPGLACTACSLV